MVSIALGIAVDDTIHLARYKLERTAGLDKDEATDCPYMKLVWALSAHQLFS